MQGVKAEGRGRKLGSSCNIGDSELFTSPQHFQLAIAGDQPMSVTQIPKPGARPVAQPQQETKYVFFFGAGKAEGNGKMKDELGGKGAGLAEMTNAGLPVPPGFTIQTAACRENMKTGKVAEAMEKETATALARPADIQTPNP